jgi:hypothetical protein
MHQNESCRQLKMAYKLTDTHFNLGLGRKMRVRLAAQVLSNTVSKTLEALVHFKQVDEDHMDTAIFCRMTNEMFDICNSASTKDGGSKRAIKASFLDQRLEDLESASKFLSSWRFVPSTKTMAAFERKKSEKKVNGKEELQPPQLKDNMPFKEGWLLSIASLKQLVPQLIQNNRFNFVRTRQFTQDHVENCFCKVRGSNGFNDRPEVC